MIGSPADSCGMNPGDIILSIDNQKINSFRELQLAILERSPGKKTSFEILRDGKNKTLVITLGRQKTDNSNRINP